MNNIITLLDSSIEEELTIIFTVMVLIILSVLCLTIIKKLKDK